jgi:hypothetical protein
MKRVDLSSTLFVLFYQLFGTAPEYNDILQEHTITLPQISPVHLFLPLIFYG